MRKDYFILILFLILVTGGVLWKQRIVSSRTPPVPKVASSSYSLKLPIKPVVVTETLTSTAHFSEAEKTDTQNKLRILDEIFKSKNDNDPRLDLEFNNLSSQAKEALEQEYNQLRVESRNERGTIVFLLGRNLNSAQDFAFLKTVVSEPPCLSLSDCAVGSTEDSHSAAASGQAITLEYPQIVALKSIENYLGKNPNAPESSDARTVINEALKSKSIVVSHLASTLFKAHSKDAGRPII